MKSLIVHFAKNWIAWRFRKRSPFLISFCLSGSLLLAALGLGSISGKLKYNEMELEILHGDSTVFSHLNTVVLIAMFVLFCSFIILLIQFFRDLSLETKKKVFVIEGRGLRDDDGTSLAESIGYGLPKSRMPHLLDLRQKLDGELVAPELLIPKIQAAKEAQNQFRRGNGRDNTQVVYGGLTAVPLTFLTGVELDDEGEISVFDWDRSSEKWRPLDDIDDGFRFSEPDLNEVSLPEKIVLALAVSYPVDQDDLNTSFSFPVIRMELENSSSSSHWSALKQAALADQFLEISKKLSSCGVKHIHLVLAAPNSVVFNFGRRYDKRNLPEITVYQYERSQDPKYPWGIRMPVGATQAAHIETLTTRHTT